MGPGCKVLLWRIVSGQHVVENCEVMSAGSVSVCLADLTAEFDSVDEVWLC